MVLTLLAGACGSDEPREFATEPTEAVAAPSAAEPAEDSGSEPAEDPAGAADEPVGNGADEPVDEPADAADEHAGAADEPADDPSGAADEPADEPADAADEPADEPADAADEPFDEPPAEAVEEPAEEPAAEPQVAGDGADDDEAGSGADDDEADDGAPAEPVAPGVPDPTPLPVDPAVRIGMLDNGLTYYLRSNDKPGSNLSLRLAVNAGSLHEATPGSGVAHFLEHMMFNGTQKFPGNQILEELRRLGVEFGPDTNAYTTYDATVYELDVLTNREGTVTGAFDTLAQWAHAATIAEADVVAERGVVRDEYRIRAESAAGVILDVFDRTYVEGTPYEGRDPIGAAETIEAMAAEELRTFYETWYVPSNMALVAVGELPLDELERLVSEYFGAIGAGEAPPAPDTDSPLDVEPSYGIAASAGQGYSYLSLDVQLPAWNPGTVGGERMLLLEELIAVILDIRLQDAYEQGFLSQIDPAKWLEFSYTDGLRFYGTNLRADDFNAALGDFWSMMLTLEEAGFDAEDLEHAAEVVEADLAYLLEAVPTTQDREYAARYVEHFLAGADIGTVAAGVTRIADVLAGVAPEDLTNHFRWIMRNSGPILLAVGESAAEVPTTTEMRAAIEAATPGELPERAAEVEQLVEAPAPVDPVFSEWTFANGATVVFVPSDISEAHVELVATSQGGWSTMEPGERGLTGRLATRAVRNSGIAGLSPAQVSRFLDDNNVSLVPYIDETTEGFVGEASSDGLEAMFQRLHLFVTAPQVDDQAFAEAAQVGEIVISLAESDPNWQVWVAFLQANHGEAYEWFDPVGTQEAVDALTAESLLARYQARLGDVDDLLVALVGDVDVETVERLARTYIGTLPAGESDTFVNRRVPEPAGVITTEVVLTPDSGATGLTFYHQAQLDITPAVDVALDVLESLLGARFDAEVREEIGASYDVSIVASARLTPIHHVTSEIGASGDPERMDEIGEQIIGILDDLVENGPGAEEWAQALAVVSADYTHVSNQDLLDAVLRSAHVPDDQLPTVERLVEEFADITPADVGALAAALFDPNQRIEIRRVLAG